MASTMSGWVDKALDDFDSSTADRYRSKASFLDRAFAGISDDVKIHTLRIMVNLGMPADDPTFIFVALYGYLREAGAVIPSEIRSASREFSGLLDTFTQEAQIFPEVIAQVHKTVAAEIQQEASEIGKAAVRAAGIHELEEHKFRLTAASEDVLHTLAENVVKQRQKITTDVLILRHRVITAVSALVVFAAGWGGGVMWGLDHARLNSVQAEQVQYGKTYIQMYGDMPSDMRSWVRNWSSHHTVR